MYGIVSHHPKERNPYKETSNDSTYIDLLIAREYRVEVLISLLF